MGPHISKPYPEYILDEAKLKGEFELVSNLNQGVQRPRLSFLSPLSSLRMEDLSKGYRRRRRTLERSYHRLLTQGHGRDFNQVENMHPNLSFQSNHFVPTFFISVSPAIYLCFPVFLSFCLSVFLAVGREKYFLSCLRLRRSLLTIGLLTIVVFIKKCFVGHRCEKKLSTPRVDSI